MEIIKSDEIAATKKLDNMLKTEAENGKLNYLLVVKLKKNNKVHVSGHGNKKTLKPLKKFINKFIKNY